MKCICYTPSGDVYRKHHIDLSITDNVHSIPRSARGIVKSRTCAECNLLQGWFKVKQSSPRLVQCQTFQVGSRSGSNREVDQIGSRSSNPHLDWFTVRFKQPSPNLQVSSRSRPNRGRLLTVLYATICVKAISHKQLE